MSQLPLPPTLFPSFVSGQSDPGIPNLAAQVVYCYSGITYRSTPANLWAAGVQSTLSFTNPPTSSDLNNAYLQSITHVQDFTPVNPDFSDTNSLEYNLYFTCGRNQFDASAKTTSILLDLYMQANGAGQRFPIGLNFQCFGMGDASPLNINAVYGGGADANGDQGQYLGLFSVSQDGTLRQTTITGSYTSMVGQSTTLGQNVTKSQGSQTITVGSTAAMATDDYLTVNPQPPGGSLHDGGSEANQDVWGPITVLSGTTISVPNVNRNQSSGVTIRGATRLTVSNPTGFGQHRILINRTQAAYTTGTAAVTAGTNNVVGSGTLWTSFGSTLSPGAISFAADNNTGSPFSVGSPLQDVYLIMQVTDDTHLTFLHRSFQITAYTGKATSQGAYTIFPAARIWWYGDPGSPNKDSKALVLPYNTFTWTIGDTVECCISPEFYFNGWATTVTAYSTGCTLSPVWQIINGGPVPFPVFSFTAADGDYSKARFGTVGQIYGATTGLLFGHMFGPCFDFADSATGFEWSSSATRAGGYYNATTGCLELFFGGPSAYVAPSGGVTTAQQSLLWVSQRNISGNQAELSLGAGLVQTNEGCTGFNQPYHTFRFNHSGSILLVEETITSLATVGWSYGGQTLTLYRPFMSGTYRAGAIKQITHASSPYAINPQTDEIVLVDASAGAVTVTIPNCSIYWGVFPGQEFLIKKVDSTANAVMLNRNGSDLFDGAQATPAYTLSAQNKFVRFAVNGGDWIAGVTNLVGGSGFTDGTYTLGVSSGSATGTYTCSGGAVVSVSITNPGSGYYTVGAPTLSFPSGGGTGASATAVLNAAYVVGSN